MWHYGGRERNIFQNTIRAIYLYHTFVQCNYVQIKNFKFCAALYIMLANYKRKVYAYEKMYTKTALLI